MNKKGKDQTDVPNLPASSEEGAKDPMESLHKSVLGYLAEHYGTVNQFCKKSGISSSTFSSSKTRKSKLNARIFIKMKELDPDLDLNVLFVEKHSYTGRKDYAQVNESLTAYETPSSRLEKRLEEILITLNTKIKEIDLTS